MSTQTNAAAAHRIAAATVPGSVSLTVSDLERATRFYEQVIGLRAGELADGGVALAVPGGAPLVKLYGDRSAAPLNRRSPGLYHVAILLPSRRDLAHAVGRLVRAGWPLDGASDHLVSEALYLSDPEGNGIEIYRDRPRGEWTYDSGQLQMATLPLDLQGVYDELAGAEPAPDVPAGTSVGHVHLQVSDIPAAEAFYHGIIGLDVMVRGYPGALFVSAGGYHHHIGLNTWHSAGAPPAAPGSVGLRAYELTVPDADELARVLDRVAAAGIERSDLDGGAAAVRGPFGNLLVLRAADGAGAPAA